MSMPLGPLTIQKDDDPGFMFIGVRTWIKATSDQMDGRFGLIEQSLPPGFATPFHAHHDTDEAFYVLEGELSFVTETQKISAGPGTYLYWPRHARHGFRVVGDVPARILNLFLPGGLESFFLDVSEAGLTNPPTEAAEFETLQTIATKYSTELLGHMPE